MSAHGNATPGNATLVRNAMKHVVGDLELVLGDLKAVVGDIRSLVNQIETVTNKIDDGKKEILKTPGRRHSVSHIQTHHKPKSSSVRHSFSESCDILQCHQEIVFNPIRDTPEIKFPEPKSIPSKSASSQIKAVRTSNVEYYDSKPYFSRCPLIHEIEQPLQQPSGKESMRLEAGLDVTFFNGRHLRNTKNTKQQTEPTDQKNRQSLDLGSVGSSQECNTSTSWSSGSPVNTQYNPGEKTTEADGGYCGVYEKELDMKLELAFDDELDCYTSIDDGDTLDLHSYRVYRAAKDSSKNVSPPLMSQNLPDILNEDIAHKAFISCPYSQLSQEDIVSNYGSYRTSDGSDTKLYIV